MELNRIDESDYPTAALAEGEALCARLAASRAPLYGPREIREIEGLKTQIEEIVLGAHLAAETREAAGLREEASQARAAAAGLRSRLAILLSSL